MIDTLFANYLRGKYGSTATMRDAYWEGSHANGPNLISNPGFEVNPVSAVAPGLFRKLFEYGSSSGTTTQKHEKSN